VKLLLDTHVLIWWLTNNPTLAAKAKNAIADPDNLVFVSAVSAWEIAIKKSLGKLQAPDDLTEQIKAKNFIPLAISIEHAVMVEQLPLHHQDPFDRILIAQGIYEQLIIVTRDRKFSFYQVNTIKS
jgi:PIN domain nuclease of toxin-antitoxin system